MTKEKIIRQLISSDNPDKDPDISKAIPLNDGYAFTNGFALFTDKENRAGLPLLPAFKERESFARAITNFFEKPFKFSARIDKKALDRFMKDNKMRYGAGKLIILEHEGWFYGFNAKYLWWIIDYAKTNILHFIECRGNFYSVATQGDDCACVLLPVRLDQRNYSDDRVFKIEKMEV